MNADAVDRVRRFLDAREASFYCYPCVRGDHDEHKLAWVPDIPCECPKCVHR